MDSHVFRRVCEALLPDLPGARLEKIQQPGPGVCIFTLYGLFGGEARKRYLALRSDRKSPLLFLAENNIPAGVHPPAPIMRLRKYLGGRRITAASCHWTDRRLYLAFAGEGAPVLTLDLRDGPSLLFGAMPAFTEPAWPQPSGTDGVPFAPALPEDGEWRLWPVLTPALRRTLPYLDAWEAQALLRDLEAGGGDIFVYRHEADKADGIALSAWPLPKAQLTAMGGGLRESVWPYPLPALALAGERMVYAPLAAKARQAAAMPFSAEAARLTRLQHKLDGEEERLLALCAESEQALSLQSQLYRFAADARAASITLDIQGRPRDIALDPRLTIRENMAAMFHRAGRGKRGLEHLARRRQAVAAEKEEAMRAMLRGEAALGGPGYAKPGCAWDDKRALGHGGATGEGTASGLPRQVQAFRSSDGFILLRGRDNKGNALALKLAAPHDYWLHSAQGPSAHVIIRRAHAGQDVPRRTLEEAGILAALKSWLKDETQAEIQYSLAKYIHPMKKAAPGTVRVDRSEGAFLVRLEADLETRLAMSA